MLDDDEPNAQRLEALANAGDAGGVILSNGNLHYLWDLERGSPYIITKFPTQTSVLGYQRIAPGPQRLINEQIGWDYIAPTQRPGYANDAGWKNETERPEYIKTNKLRFLRGYQQRAIHAIQRAVKKDKDRFLFEMATGTGKTLLAAAVIKFVSAHRKCEPSTVSRRPATANSDTARSKNHAIW